MDNINKPLLQKNTNKEKEDSSSYHSTSNSSSGELEEILIHKDKDKDKEDDVCLICYSDDENVSFCNIEKQYICKKQCDCKIIIHEKCLINWYNHSESCPICRKDLEITTYCEKFCIFIGRVMSCLSVICALGFAIYFFIDITKTAVFEF